MTMKYFTLPFCGGIDAVLRDRMGWEKVNNIAQAQAVIFGGGTDISTSFYRQVPIKETSSPDVNRDRSERDVFKSLGKDVWKIGICRGSQLLCALTGGALWQHVDNHAGKKHSVNYFDVETKSWLAGKTNSVHHQVCRPPADSVVLAYANEATVFKDMHETVHVNNAMECEVWASPENKVFGFQGHPEYGDPDTIDLFIKLLTNVIEGKVK